MKFEKIAEFRLQPDLPQTNPLGNYNATVTDKYVYIGSVGWVSGYDIKTLKPVFRIPVSQISQPGNALRALTVVGDTRLLVSVDQTLALYDNTQPTQPTLITTLMLKTTIIDIVSFVSIVYVLTQEGLITVEVSPTSLRILQRQSFAANLNAGIILESRQTALYVSAITHGAFYVFDIVTNPRSPTLVQTLTDNLYPVDMTQTSCYPQLLLSGGIFGFTFYNVENPLKIRVINQQPSPYLNLVRFLPGTPFVVNGLYLPTNQLVAGMIEYSRKKRIFSYQPSSRFPSLPIQFGRLPWDVALVPGASSAKRRTYQIIITNNTEQTVNVARIKLKKGIL